LRGASGPRMNDIVYISDYSLQRDLAVARAQQTRAYGSRPCLPCAATSARSFVPLIYYILHITIYTSYHNIYIYIVYIYKYIYCLLELCIEIKYAVRLYIITVSHTVRIPTNNVYHSSRISARRILSHVLCIMISGYL
jgi:hypothetical protein